MHSKYEINTNQKLENYFTQNKNIGTELNIANKEINVVLLNSDTLGRYCQKECLSSIDGMADFKSIKSIIEENKFSDISTFIDDLIIERYGT